MFCSFGAANEYIQYSRTRMENHLSHSLMGYGVCSVQFPPDTSPTKFGFLARGVYLVPPPMFPLELRHCGTFKVFIPYPLGRRYFPCRQPLLRAALAYGFARHEHYRHHSLCEHGLSSQILHLRDSHRFCMKYLLFIISYKAYFNN